MIRRMTEDDIISVEQIENKSFSDPWSERAFRDSLGNESSVFVISEDDKGCLQGYVCLYSAADEGEIVKVAVDPEARRLHIGKAIMEEVFRIGEEKQLSNYYLEVRKSNIGAIEFYKSLGFLDIGTRKNFYDHPTEDAVIMVKGVN